MMRREGGTAARSWSSRYSFTCSKGMAHRIWPTEGQRERGGERLGGGERWSRDQDGDEDGVGE